MPAEMVRTTQLERRSHCVLPRHACSARSQEATAMDKVRFALTTIAALAAAPAALAQSTGAGSAPPSTSDPHAGHTMTPPSSSTTTSSAGAAVSAGPTGASVQTTPPTTTTTTPGTTVPGTMGPGTVQTSTPPPVQTTTVPVGTTRITQAEMLPPSTTPPTRETVTVKQSFRPNRPLLITGSALFVGSYATTAALTAADLYDGAGDRSMYIPVVGPWMHLASFSDSGWDQALVIGSGIAQGAGVGLAIASLFIPEKVDAATIQAGNVKVNLTATSMGRGSGGIGAVGSF
jgi:hypothetical protein